MLQNNITEALRLFPPLIMLMRQVKRAFTVTTRTGHTYTIPKVLLLSRVCSSICKGTAMVKISRYNVRSTPSIDPKKPFISLPPARAAPAPCPRCCLGLVQSSRIRACP